MLVIMSGFLRGEEVDAVLQFVGRKHAVSDRDRAPGHAVPQYERRGNAGLEPHARPLAAFDLVVGEVPGRSAIGRDRPDSDMPAVRHRAHDRAHHFAGAARSEEHTSELQSLMRISYAVFCLTTKTQ